MKLASFLTIALSHLVQCPNFRDTLGRLAAEHMRSLGFDYTIHQLRGSCATELARVTHGDVIRIARFLGHVSLTSTQRYLAHAELGKMRAALERSA